MIEEKKTDLLSKITNIVFSIVCYGITILCLLVTIFSISSKNNDGVATFNDTAVLAVRTESMNGIIDKGDLIFINTKFDTAKFVENQTIATFYCDINNDGNLEIVTHRFIKKDGTTFVFQGVYKHNKDDVLAFQYVNESSIIGVYNDSKINGVGNLILMLQSSVGFFICFILPIFLFACYQGYKLVITIMEVKEEKVSKVIEKELTDEQLKLIKENIRQEILDELKSKKE